MEASGLNMDHPAIRYAVVIGTAALLQYAVFSQFRIAGVSADLFLVVAIAAGIVAWPHAIIGLIGGVCGGYIGVKLARRVPTKFIRWIVVSFGTILTLRFALA